MILTTTPVALDTEDVSTVVESLRGISLLGAAKILLLIAVLAALVRLGMTLFERILKKSRVDRSFHGFLRNGVKIFLIFVAVMIVAGSLNVDVTSLVALLSVIGLALSLALQDSLSNLASGLVILTTRPLRVGDYVGIGDSEGYVEEIGMTYTKLSTYDKRIIFVPNHVVTSTDIVNFTVAGRRRVELVVSASYDDDVDKVKAALRKAVDTMGNFYTDPPVQIRIKNYGESAIEYLVWAWCATESYWDQYYGLMEEVKRTFDKEGVRMTYPHLNVHIQEKP